MYINFVIGTKAQFIKCIPLINEFITSWVNIRLYDLKQHSKITSNLKQKINKGYEYIEYSKNSQDIGTYGGLLRWFINSFIKVLFSTDKNIESSYCFVHGDTISTLIGTFFIKRNKGILVLLEAGHSVPGVLKHFPESIIRYISAKTADFIIATGESQITQLKKWGVKGKIIEISRNTIYDSVTNVTLNEKATNNVIVSIHRTENINNKSRMALLVKTLCKLDDEFNIIWHLHIPTKNMLKSHKLLNKLNKQNIHLKDLEEYDIFINKIFNSEFVITDGGGVVEECKIIGTPTLVWRNEHLDQNQIFEKSKNLFLSNYDEEDIEYFFDNYKNLKENFELTNQVSPSKEIVEELKKLIY